MWYKVKKIYVGTTKVRPYHFNPTSSTVLYYPFETDQLDKVWSSSIAVTGSKQTLGYTFNSSSNIAINTPPTTCRFVSYWIKYNSSNWNYTQWPYTYIWQMLYNFKHSLTYLNQAFQYHSTYRWNTGLEYPHSSAQSTSTWNWYYMAYWTDWSKVYAYLNWNKVWEATITPWLDSNTVMNLWNQINMTISDLIWEKRVWTATEVSNYYNQTKANYWL